MSEKRFSYKKFSKYCKKRCEDENINIEKYVSKFELPNQNYIFNIVKDEKSQTLRDIFIGLGWDKEVDDKISFEIGKIINMVIVQRNFEKIEVYNNKNDIILVRLYHWYEVPFIVSIIYSFFGLNELIPKHWSYAFFEETNINYIIYNLLNSNIELSDIQRKKLKELNYNKSKLKNIENILYNKSNILINKDHIFKDYYLINAKYGIPIELFLLNYINNN